MVEENKPIDEGKRDYGDTVSINTRISTELADRLKDENPGVSMSKIIQAALTEYASRKRCVMCGTMNDSDSHTCKKCNSALFSNDEVMDAVTILANSGVGLLEPVPPNELVVDMRERFTKLKQQGVDVSFEPAIKMFSNRIPRYMVKLNLSSSVDGVELSLKDGYNEYIVSEKAIQFYLVNREIPYNEINNLI